MFTVRTRIKFMVLFVNLLDINICSEGILCIFSFGISRSLLKMSMCFALCFEIQSLIKGFYTVNKRFEISLKLPQNQRKYPMQLKITEQVFPRIINWHCFHLPCLALSQKTKYCFCLKYIKQLAALSTLWLLRLLWSSAVDT